MELEYVKNYIQVDYDDDDALIELFIEVGKQYITNGFSEYNETNPSHKLLLLKAVKSLYDSRDNNNDKIYLSIKLQQMLGDSDD